MKKSAILIDDDVFMHADVPLRLKGIPQLDIVYKALSVDDAMAYFENHPEGVDVIFCDIMMPGKDGYEANRLLAGFCKLFIFLTQKNEHGEEIYGAASMVHYLRKPIKPAEVSLLLAQLDDAEEAAAGTGSPSNFVFVDDRHSKVKVFTYVSDILMVDFEKKYGEVTIAGRGNKMIIHGTVQDTVRKLKASGLFIRINQHCIVSVSAIKEVDKQLVVYFHFGGYQAVTRTYQSAFRAFMKRHGLG